MGKTLIVPNPQRRYLEPFKNRVFQYDTKHSNLFLSQYVNQILNAVGDDSIVRGLEVDPVINPYKTGIDFTVKRGALIQDLTYFELPTDMLIQVDNVINFPDYYIIIYTNWRYIETVYSNDLKLEATFYNPITCRTITGWSSLTNRVILGVFKYTINSKNEITSISKIPDEITFEDTNIITNGGFDQKNYKYWSAINSSMKLIDHGGLYNTPYLHVTPIAEDYQGIGQCISTKKGHTYEISFFLKADCPMPIKGLVLDGDSLYNMNATELSSYPTTASSSWVQHKFRFDAISTKSTVFILKTNTSLDDSFDLDQICCYEIMQARKQTDINKISTIDGGDLDASE